MPSRESSEMFRRRGFRSLGKADPKYVIDKPADLDLSKLCRIDRYFQIDMKLDEIVASATLQPVWQEAWNRSRLRGLIRMDPAEVTNPWDRLAAWKTIRASGDLPPDAAFYLIADQIRFLTEIRIAEPLDQPNAKMADQFSDAVVSSFGHSSSRDQEQDRSVAEVSPVAWDRYYVEELRKHGEAGIADLFCSDRQQFSAKLAAGQAFFGRAAIDEDGST